MGANSITWLLICFFLKINFHELLKRNAIEINYYSEKWQTNEVLSLLRKSNKQACYSNILSIKMVTTTTNRKMAVDINSLFFFFISNLIVAKLSYFLKDATEL